MSFSSENVSGEWEFQGRAEFDRLYKDAERTLPSDESTPTIADMYINGDGDSLYVFTDGVWMTFNDDDEDVDGGKFPPGWTFTNPAWHFEKW